MTEKTRADIALVARGLAESREKAQAAIMAGHVYLGERKICKASETVRTEDPLEVRNPTVGYVSRGALKLEKAVDAFHADLKQKIIVATGASTGGFTDVCLQKGASKVYAVDVGYGQLDWKLRNDPRVIVMERTNARYLTPEMFAEKPAIAVMDVSFISVTLILPALIGIIGNDGIIYTLIKPQFEAGREKVGKKGVVRDPAVHREVMESVISYAESIGLSVLHLDYSPVKGPEGNIEYLLHLKRGEQEGNPEEIETVVRAAHAELDR